MPRPSPRDISHGLYGAWRLAMLDRDAMRYFDTTEDGFWKSFHVALYVAPAFAITIYVSLHATPPPAEVGLLEILAVEATRYVMSWAAFPLLMATVADMLQRGERYVGFVVAFNWAQLVEMAVVLPVFLLVVASGLPPNQPNVVYAILFFAVCFYYWFIARTALQISGWAAGAIVILNMLLSGVIESAADAVLG